MTEQEAFAAWFKDQYDADPENKEMFCAASQNIAWHAALAWLRSQGEPVAWMAEDSRGERAYNSVDRFSYGRSGGIPLYLAPQPVIPDGWQLVPKVLTDDMRSAVGDAETHDEAWKRFLAAAPQPVIPDGWQLVPVEPTEEMCLAYTKCKTEAGEKWARHQWAAMLAAAPEPRK